MAKRKRARWLWAAWAFTAGGCAAVAGLEDGYHVLEGGSGGTGTGGHAGAGGEVGGGTGGGGTGGGAGAGGGVGAGGGDDCDPGAVRCAENRPQRCDERGGWEDAEPCPAAAPVCEAGKCVPPSCVGLAEMCGPGGDESCCARAEEVGRADTGNRFHRDNNTAYPATVNGFLLDRFEVTVGRFRRFVEAYPGSRPAAGAGAHRLIEGSGWSEGWNGELPPDAAALRAAVMCNNQDNPAMRTWTEEAGAQEHLPMNCLSWYVAFAFCAWDGGRLATEAEWNYAAAGGDEQRAYPWSTPASSTTIDATYAVYQCTADGACTFSEIQPVGSRSPAGDGKWRQADLAGNMWEWALDWYAAAYPNECNNCANNAIEMPAGTDRVIRGGGLNYGEADLLSSRRSSFYPSSSAFFVGARCARTPPDRL